MSTNYVQAPVLYLAGSGVIVGATSAALTNFQDIYGNVLTMTDFGSTGYITFEPDTSNEEAASFTGITANANGTYTLTGLKTGLAKSPYTETSGLVRAHAGGTKVIITDTVQHINNFVNKNNDSTISGIVTFSSNPIVPTPINGDDAANKNYVLSVVSGGTVTTNAIIETGTAGETILIGQVVYLKVSDGRWWKANASTLATVDRVQLGIAQGGGTAGVAITGGVLRKGVDTNQAGGSAGALGYIRNAGGTVNTTAGTISFVIGNFLTATTFDFDPAYYQTPSPDEKNAMAGGGDYGTPSSSNKFATADYVNPSMYRFGNGADGDVIISGNTTLTRDMFYDNLTVNIGVTLNTGSFRIFVKGILTVNGTIARNGGNGSGASGGTLSGGSLIGSVAGGDGGGGGGDGAPGSAGVIGNNVTDALDASNGVAGGAGGQDGSETFAGGTAGAGGTTTAAAQPLVPGYSLDTVSFLNTLGTFTRFTVSATGGGGGGGGGGSTGTGRPGGAGGGAGSTGGIVFIFAKTIVIGVSGAITALGGTGANGTDGTGGTGACGGGGGGGAGGNGGIIILYYRTLTNNGVANILVTGGAGGSGGAGGISSDGAPSNGNPGVAGTSGNAGTIYQFDI